MSFLANVIERITLFKIIGLIHHAIQCFYLKFQISDFTFQISDIILKAEKFVKLFLNIFYSDINY